MTVTMQEKPSFQLETGGSGGQCEVTVSGRSHTQPDEIVVPQLPDHSSPMETPGQSDKGKERH